MSTPDSISNADAERRATLADWLLGLSLLSSLPLIVVYSCDLWLRSDYRFFPLLMLVPLAMPVWRSPKQSESGANFTSPTNVISRRPISLAVWCASVLSALCASLLFSPWLAMLALTLSWIAWLLVRMKRTSWPRLLKWTLPLMVLLLLPLGEHSDPLPNFSSSVTYASSNLLDLLGVAHLPSEQTHQLQSGRYDVAAACRGLGNPYLLLSLAVLLCMSTRCSFSVGLLTVGSAPLWSWGGSVWLVTSSVWLAEKHNIFIWIGERLWIAQAFVLVIDLISLLLLKWGLQQLWAPFTAPSEGVGGIHKFYNLVVLWPEPDPLRKRLPRERSKSNTPDDPADTSPGSVRRRANALVVVACLFVIAGGVTIMRLATGGPFEQPNRTELLSHPSATRARVEKRLQRETLPDEFFDMRLVGFDEFATPGSGTGVPLTVRWTYTNGAQYVELLAKAPYRGSLAMERQRLLDGSRIVTPLQTLELNLKAADHATQDVSDDNSSQVPLDHVFRFDELTLVDSLAGLSYLAYTNWTIEGSGRDAEPLGTSGVWSKVLKSIRYQPTSASLSLWLEGATPQSDEDKQNLRRMLGHAAELVRNALAD